MGPFIRMIKLSDYVIQFLVDHGVRHIFLLTGGGAMHLNDSIGKEKRLTYICTHHEQAAAMAAEAYARVTGGPGVINVTTGPGGINALNGVFGAWTDSIPMLVISGQVKRETCMAAQGVTDLRQLGDQEANVTRMAAGITKYAALVVDPTSIRCHLERAYHLATSGRPGPCWLDIPVDVQSAMIDPDSLPTYDPTPDSIGWDRMQISQTCEQVIQHLRRAQRPVILAGTGVRIANALPEFEQLIRMLRIPVTTAWTHDLIASDDELSCGRPGSIGGRAGNFVVQNADVLLILGSRLNVRQVSYNWKSFARNAFKIQVDIDSAELHKPLVSPDLPVHCNLKIFLAEMVQQLCRCPYDTSARAPWLAWCRERLAKYPAVLPKHRNSSGPNLNPYHFIELLFAALTHDDVVVCGDGAACVVTFQAASLQRGQRLFSNSGAASMGYDLPAAVGAAVARQGKRVICLAGDGSIQLNLQELQTVVHHQLPIKIFVLNNGGYLSMRTTQSGFFDHFVGVDSASGISFPDMVKIATAYGIPSCRLQSADTGLIEKVLDTPGPALVEVILDPSQEFEPRMKSKQLPDGSISTPALEDMYPFLDSEEMKSNML